MIFITFEYLKCFDFNDFQEAWVGSAVSNYMLTNYEEALIAIQKL